MTRFKYLQDPLFLCAAGAYCINRWYLKPLLPWPFLQNYFNDLLTLPAALPVMLWIQRRLDLRPGSLPPSASEIALHLVIWSIICELLGPFWLRMGTSDPLDILAYAAGGLAGWWIWNRHGN